MKRIRVLFGVLAVAVFLAATGTISDGATVVAQFLYGVRYERLSSKPSNCPEGRSCDWVDLNGVKHYWNGTADTKTPNVAATAKGDIPVYTGSAWTKRSVGTNGQCLKAKSTNSDGVEWGSCGGGSGSLQDAYDGGSIILLDEANDYGVTLRFDPANFEDLPFQLADRTTGSIVAGFLVDGTAFTPALMDPNTGQVHNLPSTGSGEICIADATQALSNKSIDRLNVTGTTSQNAIVSNVADGASAVANKISSNCATTGCSMLDLQTSSTRRMAVIKTASGWQLIGPSTAGLEFHGSAAGLILGSSTNYIDVNWDLGNAIDVHAGGVLIWRGTTNVEQHGGGHQFKRTTVADAPYSVGASDHVIQYTSLTATRQVTLQAAATAGEGREIVVVDGAGTANANNITFAVSGGGTLYGTATISTARGTRRLWCDGSAWYVIN